MKAINPIVRKVTKGNTTAVVQQLITGSRAGRYRLRLYTLGTSSKFISTYSESYHTKSLERALEGQDIAIEDCIHGSKFKTFWFKRPHNCLSACA